MLLPVIERFAELGWQAFVEPGETYELFRVAEVFKRAQIDTNAHSSDGAPHIVQRNALFDVCVRSGLSHLIVGYVRATAPSSLQGGESLIVGKQYILTEPIAVQQWLRRRVDELEKLVHAEAAAYSNNHHHRRNSTKTGDKASDSSMRELSGLRAIAIALIGRFKEGAQQLEADALIGRPRLAPGHNQHPDEALKQTELVRLTKDGIQNLLEVLFRIQSISLTHQCVHWFQEREIFFDADQYQEFYYQARSARASLRQSFEGGYDVVMSSISNSDIAFPSLLIELVMQSANLGHHVSLPPSSPLDLFKLLQAPVVHEDMVLAYAEDVSTEPVEVLFRVPSALLLYFALDMAYVSLAERRKHNQQGWTGSDLVAEFIDIADSFAAQMDVPDDMKATLVAIWLIENAVNVRLTSNDEVGPIYHGAVTRILESSAMHLQRKAGLEPDLIVYMIETLVHRGESSVAWKIWTAFDMVLSELPAVATEYVVMVNLELSAWERALSLLRTQNRIDVFELVLKWLIKSHRMKELVHYTTLSKQEEAIFDEFMMGGRFLSEAVLHDSSVRKADLLVMYHVLRNDFDKAWATHHEHLALIRESSGGNTNVAHAVLHQQSFRIRAALLQNMKPEPTSTAREHGYNFKRSFKPTRPTDTDVLMIGSTNGFPILQLPEPSASEDDDGMSDDVPFLSSSQPPSSSLPVPSLPTVDTSPASVQVAPPPVAVAYSPGIYSSRSSQPRSKSPLAGDATSTPVVTTSQPTVPIGSIDSSPFVSSKHQSKAAAADGAASKRVVQALNFGSSPVAPRSATSNDGEATLPLVQQPVRAAFNSSSSDFQPVPTNASNEELSLKPRPIAVVSTPVDVQMGTQDNTTDATEQSTTSAVAAAASSTALDVAVFETPKRFSFVREPQTDSRIFAKPPHTPPRSPATQELEAMELEPIDEEFSTPTSRDRTGSGARRKEAQSTPSRRNPRRVSRTGY